MFTSYNLDYCIRSIIPGHYGQRRVTCQELGYKYMTVKLVYLREYSPCLTLQYIRSGNLVYLYSAVHFSTLDCVT